MRIRAGGEEDAHHLDVGGVGSDDKRRGANGVVISAGSSPAVPGRPGCHLEIRVCAVRQERLDEPQLGVAIGNSADRIDEPIHRI